MSRPVTEWERTHARPTCPICDRTFYSANALHEHVRKHLPIRRPAPLPVRAH